MGHLDAAGERWNHNIEYHRLVLGEIPRGATTALDVGTGDGLLATELSDIVTAVTAIDSDADVTKRASESDSRVEWVLGDFMTHEFDGVFDVVASVATLHHFRDPRAALKRMAGLVAPGGSLIVIGLARSTRPTDLLCDIIGAVQHRTRNRGRIVWEHSAPTVWPPPHSYTDIKKLVRSALPSARYRRLAYWRYSVVWQRSET